MLRVDVDVRDALAMLNGLEVKLRDVVIVRALNRAIDAARTHAVRTIQKRYTLQGRYIRRNMRLVRSTRSSLVATLIAHHKEQHLTDFAGTRQTKRGVSVQIRRGGARKLVRSAFIAPAKNSGKRMVFHRAETKSTPKEQWSKRSPIYVRRSVSAAQAMASELDHGELRDVVRAKLVERMQHELKRVLQT